MGRNHDHCHDEDTSCYPQCENFFPIATECEYIGYRCVFCPTCCRPQRCPCWRCGCDELTIIICKCHGDLFCYVEENDDDDNDCLREIE